MAASTTVLRKCIPDTLCTPNDQLGNRQAGPISATPDSTGLTAETVAFNAPTDHHKMTLSRPVHDSCSTADADRRDRHLTADGVRRRR